MALNEKAFAYGKKLIMSGGYNAGAAYDGGATKEDHYLGDGSLYPFIAEIAGADIVFRSALLSIVTDAYLDTEVVEAAEDLLARIESAMIAAEGSQEIVGQQSEAPPPPPPPGGGKPPADIGTSADLKNAVKREWVGSSLHRAVNFNRSSIDEEARTVEVAFSSTSGYERFFGIEILGHKDGECDLSRLNTAAAVLVDHDIRDQVGVIEKAWIDGEKGRAVLRFSRSQRGNEIFTDVKDGIRQLVSVGYMVNGVKEIEAGSEDEPAIFYVNSWQPFEVSIVAVPADTSVGVGRGRSREETDAGASEESKAVDAETIVTKPITTNMEVKNMADKIKIETPDSDPKADLTKVRAEGADKEKSRVRDLMEYADVQKDLPSEILQKAITDDKSIHELAKDYMVWKRAQNIEAAKSAIPNEDAEGFSIMRLARYLAQPTRENEREAGREIEMCEAEAQRRGGTVNGMAIPGNIWHRDLTVGTNTAGGYLKPTEHGALIDMLRPKSYMLQLGTTIPGLVGDASFPTQSGGATAYWVAEGSAVTESQQTFGQVLMQPKTIGAYTDISRKLLLQSVPAVENIVRNDLLATLATEIDRVCIEGSGTPPEPTGIISTVGIGDVTTAAAGAALTWTDCVNIWKEVAKDNADTGRMAWVTSPSVVAHMMTIEKGTSGTPGNFILNNLADGLLGFPIYSTTQSPDDLTQSTGTALSALTFGNFADLLIGFWGGLTLNVDDTTLGAYGARRLIVLQDMDVAVRHPQSFAGSDDINTAA